MNFNSLVGTAIKAKRSRQHDQSALIREAIANEVWDYACERAELTLMGSEDYLDVAAQLCTYIKNHKPQSRD